MAIKTILGLDLGTNSIGWSLIKTDFEKKEGNIEGLGSRIIPMSQDIMGKFDSGVSISQTAERTGYRGVRRLYQRDNLRRERLHRILNVLNFLPEHYSKEIDFEKRLGQFRKGKEPKLNYRKNDSGNYEFLFMNSFNEMVKEFESRNQDTKIPYDWTLYFLRKKALTQKILKEELAWILLNFNQKRGYYQLRGEEEEIDTKLEEFYSLKVKEVQETEEKNAKGTWFNVILENDWVYRRQSKVPLDKWIGKHKDFIVTTQLEKDGTPKLDKEGNVKRSFRSPKEDDWGLVKTKTQKSIDTFNACHNTVGTAHYILDKLLTDPKQKIRGKLVKTIERKYYREELEAILSKQIEFHDDLNNKKLYSACIEELYPRNEAHKKNIADRGFDYLFIKDVIFYQRPLKSKKSTISNCQFETRYFNHKESGERRNSPLKGISKSHPLFQEFRLLQWFKFLKIYQKEDENGNLIDKDVTTELLPDLDSRTALFDHLTTKKEIEQKHVIQYFITGKKISKEKKENYQWNYLNKPYPCYGTISSFKSRLNKAKIRIDLTNDFVLGLWHIIYSIKDKNEFKQALNTFAYKNNLDINTFVNAFEKHPPFDNNYGAFSEKAIKKLLPLMRFGASWNEADINEETKERIDKILTGEVDENIQLRVRELISKDNRAFTAVSDFNDLQLHLASYVVYNRHSEVGDIQKWSIPADIDKYLSEFKQHSLRNPIVEQVVTETLRTVRDIWKYHGKGKENFFSEIHVELGREMKNPADKRKQISAKNSENENTNIRIKAILQELINDGARSYSPSHQEILKIYEEGIYENSPDEYNQIKLEDIDKIRKQSAPSQSDVNKYKLWLEQGYISPYTGEPIPLSDLFTEKYQIEHIIPQSRYFDNSLSNKIICESEVNQLKDNKTAYEFIKNPKMNIVDLGQGKSVRLYSLEQYESHCNKYFKRNRTKLKKLLSEDIPEGFIERQLNDSRYISKLIKGLLSNIVREDGEHESTSKNVVPVTGAITSKLKRDWGLNDKWNELIAPRFQRLNELTNSNGFGYWDDKINAFRTQVPDEISKGFNKKRIDHRHHALDALVIACCTKDHTNYITSLNTNRKNFSLVSKLRETEEIEKDGKKRTIAKAYHKPWLGFTMDAKDKLDKTIISFKKNTRVINKTRNKTWQWVDDDGQLKKKLVKQTKGDNWAIRKPLHTPLPYGEKQYSFSVMEISKNLSKTKSIINNDIRTRIENVLLRFDNKIGNASRELKKNPLLDRNGKLIKFTAFNIKETRYRKRQSISKLANRGKGGLKTYDQAVSFINKVSDNLIRKELLQHLSDNENDIDKAFTLEGIETFNNKRKIPVHKLPISEASNSKFALGNSKNTKLKFGEAEAGTNLFFALYWNDEKENRVYKTIPLNEVIEHRKWRASLVKEKRELTPMIPIENIIKGHKVQFLFSLSPNDLVYVPTDEEKEYPNLVNFNHLNKEQVERIYKMVSSSGNQCFFLRNDIATSIWNKKEFSALNKMEKDISETMIKERCWKLKVNRLGIITGIQR